MSNQELDEIINWCKKKIIDQKNDRFGLSGKRLEGYEEAMHAVMSYLHKKKG